MAWATTAACWGITLWITITVVGYMGNIKDLKISIIMGEGRQARISHGLGILVTTSRRSSSEDTHFHVGPHEERVISKKVMIRSALRSRKRLQMSVRGK